MLGQRHEIARLQSNLYRDAFRKTLRVLTVLVLIMFLLMAAIIYFILFQPSLNYYANTIDGKIIDMPVPKGS